VINDVPRAWPERILLGLLIVIWTILGLALSVLLIGLGVAAALGMAARIWWQRRRLQRDGAPQHVTVIEGEYRVLEKDPEARNGSSQK
jgi:hypothetical protein